ncbi:UDP-N-acetylglucosamine transferase subunit ALG13 homolog [Bacillus rossius redtenbacheri]|uniref:UDP-N-acetylglucosamine transferase subunit ALG13 homolog n=1 Tax=Bacillus rossius redtenbacheri TaxID=93214 RepID=UPI002FDDA149
MAFPKSNEVFVTVGTTQFDQLVSTIVDPCVLQVLKSRGYNGMTLQTGRGRPPVLVDAEACSLQVQHYSLKASLAEDITRAVLVVSHGGAGTCLEVLEAGKPLIIVVNHQLMGNHQLELAQQLQAEGYAYCCSCDTLADTLRSFDPGALRPFPRGDPAAFARSLDSMLGL